MAAVYSNSQHLDPTRASFPLGGGSPNTYPTPGGFLPNPSPRLNHQMDIGPGPMPTPMGSGLSNQMMDNRHLSPYHSSGGRSFHSESDDDESSRSSRSPPLTGAMAGSRARSGLRSHSARRDRKVEFGLPPDYIPIHESRSRGLGERSSRGRSLTPPPLSPRGSAVRRRLHGESHPSHHLTDTLHPPTSYPAYGSTSPYGSSQGSAESYSRHRSSPYAASPYGPTSLQPESIPAGTTVAPRSAYPMQPISHHNGRVRSRAQSQSHASSIPISRHRHGHHHHHRHHHRDRDSPPSDSASRPSYHRKRSRSLPPAIQPQPPVYHIQVPPPPQPNVQFIPSNPAQYPQNSSSFSYYPQGRRRTRSSSHSRPPPMQIYAPPYNNHTHHASLPHSAAGSWANAPQGRQGRPPHTGFISSLLKSLNLNKEDDHPSGGGYGMGSGHNHVSRRKEKGWKRDGHHQQYPEMSTMPMYTGGYGTGYGYGGQVAQHVPTLHQARRRDRRMSF